MIRIVNARTGTVIKAKGAPCACGCQEYLLNAVELEDLDRLRLEVVCWKCHTRREMWFKREEEENRS